MSLAAESTREQTRARYPDEEGYVERDGVRVFWESYGDGPTTFLLFPTSPISHSRLWKAQIPYLARRHRVLTFDPRGNGRSDRPTDAAAYGYWEYVEDGRAVLEAAGVDRAILVGLCDGGGWALMLASTTSRDRPRRRRARTVPPVSHAGAPELHPLSVRRAARHGRGLGEVQPPLLAPGLPRASSSSSSRSSSRSRTPRSRSRTASPGGWRRTRRRSHSPTRRRRSRGAAPRRLGALCRRVSLPGPRRPRRAGRLPDARARGGRRRSDRGHARRLRGRGPHPPGASSREGEPADPRLRRVTRKEIAVSTWTRGAQPATAGALRLLADRARARAARRRDRPRAARSSTPISRSTGSRSTRSPPCSRPRANASTR